MISFPDDSKGKSTECGTRDDPGGEDRGAGVEQDFGLCAPVFKDLEHSHNLIITLLIVYSLAGVFDISRLCIPPHTTQTPEPSPNPRPAE